MFAAIINAVAPAVKGEYEELPGFGARLAIDGKAVKTHARPRAKGAPTPGRVKEKRLDRLRSLVAA